MRRIEKSRTALALAGEADRARVCFTRALQLAPGFTAARFNLANAFLSAGLWAEAAAALRAGLVRARAVGDRKAASEIEGYLDEFE